MFFASIQPGTTAVHAPASKAVLDSKRKAVCSSTASPNNSFMLLT